MSEEKKEKDPFVIDKPTARDFYKEANAQRRARRNLEHDKAMTEAKEAYERLLADKKRKHKTTMDALVVDQRDQKQK